MDVRTGGRGRRTGSGGFYLVSPGGLLILDAADADNTVANAINRHGVVAGSVTYNSTIGVSSRVNAVTWTQEQPFILNGSDWTTAAAIDDRGWTGGFLSVGGSGPNLPIFWIPGQPAVQLPLSGGAGGFATDINKWDRWLAKSIRPRA